MKKTILIIHIFLIFFCLAILFSIILQRSISPVVFTLSFKRLLVFIAASLFGIYLVFSLFNAKLAETNILIFAGIFAGVILLETILRGYPTLIPAKFISYFDSPWLKKLQKRTGLKAAVIIGEKGCFTPICRLIKLIWNRQKTV